MLLLNYVGGERKLVITLEMKDYISHPFPFNYFFHKFQAGKTFFRLVKISTLQFVIMRPMISSLILCFSVMRMYKDSYFGLDNSYIYLFTVSNISFSVALYGLVLLYVASEELLEPYKPLPKFLSIKLVIFFSFWQGVLLELLEHF